MCLDGSQKRALLALRLRKNWLRVLPFTPALQGVLRKVGAVWTVLSPVSVRNVLGNQSLIKMNNPCKGFRAGPRRGFFAYRDFKARFLGPMYFRHAF